MNIKLNTICFILLFFLIIGLVSACDDEKIFGKNDSLNLINYHCCELSRNITHKLGTSHDLSDISENKIIYWRSTFFNNNNVSKYKKRYYDSKGKDRNKNFTENDKDIETIQSEVTKMLNQDINRHPHDFISTFNGEAFPKTNHKLLKIHGIFKTLFSTRGHTKEGHHRYMDLIEKIDPDGEEVTKDSVANIEYVISQVDDEILHDYDLSCILKFGKRVFHIFVVNKDMGRSEKIIEVSGHPVKILYRVFDEIRQWKVLSRLNEIINNNEEISVEDYVEFAHCIANSVNPHAKEYIEECVDLFTRMENIDSTCQLNLHLSLKVKIKFIFEDDIKKTEELLMMITKALPIEGYRGVSSFEEAVERSREADAEIKRLNEIILELKKEIEYLKNR